MVPGEQKCVWFVQTTRILAWRVHCILRGEIRLLKRRVSFTRENNVGLNMTAKLKLCTFIYCLYQMETFNLWKVWYSGKCNLTTEVNHWMNCLFKVLFVWVFVFYRLYLIMKLVGGDVTVQEFSSNQNIHRRQRILKHFATGKIDMWVT